MRVLALMVLISCGLLMASEEERLFITDAVALQAGETLTGQQQFRAAYSGTIYLFANQNNLETFQNAPGKYAIAMGGACARMGPLSGRGRLDLFTVHDERLYVFGSEGCRKTFLKNPSRAFDPDQKPLPDGDVEAGNKWLQKLVDVMGGETLDNASQVARSFEETIMRNEQTLKHHREDRVTFPADYFYRDNWNDRKFERMLSGDKGYFNGFEGEWAMESVQVRAMKREFLTLPVVLLRARHQPGFVAKMVGEEKIGDRMAVAVAVHYKGLGQTLLIDQENGRLLAQRYRGRGQDRLFAAIEKRFSDFQQTGGLELPATEAFTSDGLAWKTETWTWSVQ